MPVQQSEGGVNFAPNPPPDPGLGRFAVGLGLLNTGIMTFLNIKGAHERNKAVQKMFENQIRRNWLKRVQIGYNEIVTKEGISADLRRSEGKVAVSAPEAGSLSFEETVNSNLIANSVRQTHRAEHTAAMMQKAIDMEDENAKLRAEGQMVNEALAGVSALQEGISGAINLLTGVKNYEQAKKLGPMFEKIAKNQEVMTGLANVLTSLGIDILSVHGQRVKEATANQVGEIEGTGPAFGISYRSRDWSGGG